MPHNHAYIYLDKFRNMTRPAIVVSLLPDPWAQSWPGLAGQMSPLMGAIAVVELFRVAQPIASV